MSPQNLTLPDGRGLDYSVSGPADGFPLIWIHGTPGSYIPPTGIPEICHKKGLRCVTMTRSGYGGSTRRFGRKIGDCVEDIEALKKHLKIDQCVVGGWSGGGPHAIACAARLSGCLGALVVAGVAPYDLYVAEGLDWEEGQGEDNVLEFRASLKGEAALQEFVQPQRDDIIKGDVEGLVSALTTLLPECDRKALVGNPTLGQNLADSLSEGLKNSADGWVDDSLSFIQPWGFELDEIKVPVFLWQGSVDLMVPFSQGEWFVEHLPKDRLVAHLLEGEGHISIFLGRADEMIEELLSTRKAS